MGMVHAALTPTVFHRLTPGHAGVASATLKTFQQIGGAVGLAVIGSIAAHLTSQRASEVTSHITAGVAGDDQLAKEAIFQATFMSGASTAFQIGAGVLLLATVIVITRLRVPRSELVAAPPIGV